ncbi:MAG TPA: putative sulfate exporter family transporter [Solirubrobacteraceae bacterium]|nr:putative sulfate exporter family transporter [Solirubrobacteraceae bacterium]
MTEIAEGSAAVPVLRTPPPHARAEHKAPAGIRRDGGKTSPSQLYRRIDRLAPGVGLSVLVASAATGAARVVPLGSGPLLGLTLGLILGALIGPRARLRPGVKKASSSFLRVAVVVLGAELPLGAVVSEGAATLPVIVITLGGCLLAARLLGRWLSIDMTLRRLVGVGTGICGASAIAAVAPVIEAGELEVGYAVATIFLFNVLAVLAFPPLGHALGLSHHAFGVFAGTAVNDLSSVVAAAGAYGGSSLHTAVIVKLTRTLMIIPVCLVFAHRHQKAGGHAYATRIGDEASPRAGSSRLAQVGRIRIVQLVPRYLLGFLSLAALCAIGIIPSGAAGAISLVATWMITVALSAVGLSIDIRALRRAGPQPIVLGAGLWITVSLLSLGAHVAGLA